MPVLMPSLRSRRRSEATVDTTQQTARSERTQAAARTVRETSSTPQAQVQNEARNRQRPNDVDNIPHRSSDGSQSGLLHHDVLSSVAPHLDARSLAVLAGTCPSLEGGCQDDSVWQMMCKRDYGVLKASDGCTYRETYKMACNEWVLWNDGQPDYVEFLGDSEGGGADGLWTKTSRNGNPVEILCSW